MSTRRANAVLTAVFVAVPAMLAAQEAVISGKFYRYQVVGSGALPPVNDVLFQGPSINDNGVVAFAGKPSPSQNAVFVADLGAAPPRLVAAQANPFPSSVVFKSTTVSISLRWSPRSRILMGPDSTS